MADFSVASINTMLDWYSGVASAPAAATRYITIFDGEPGAGGTEVISTITGSANRQDMTTAMAAAVSAAAANDTLITFTAAAVGAADVDWVAIYSAITGGTLMGKAAVTPKSIGIGDSLTIQVGALTMGIT